MRSLAWGFDDMGGGRPELVRVWGDSMEYGVCVRE